MELHSDRGRKTVLIHMCVQAKSLNCVRLCDPMDCSLPGSSVHGILQARILECIAVPSSRGIFLTQGSNPCLLPLLNWQTGSLRFVVFQKMLGQKESSKSEDSVYKDTCIKMYKQTDYHCYGRWFPCCSRLFELDFCSSKPKASELNQGTPWRAFLKSNSWYPSSICSFDKEKLITRRCHSLRFHLGIFLRAFDDIMFLLMHHSIISTPGNLLLSVRHGIKKTAPQREPAGQDSKWA